MSQVPDYTNVSVALSEVLAEIGVNDVIMKKRRRTFLVMETVGTVSWSMIGRNIRMYIFGSQIEGTTTRGLNSDRDAVISFCNRHVIKDWKEWKHGFPNLLMVEAETTPPGYCMLQVLKPDVPLPEIEIFNEHYFRDRQGRILLKNSVHMLERPEGQEQHGPAFVDQGGNGIVAMDTVLAYTCSSQLPVVQHWLSQLQGPWPSEDVKKDIASSPCFVVPVGSRGSVYETFEWRISTSLAERCLMFSLNVTQLQVYVLMKMLLKTSINYNVPEENHISSFMCKTVLLHCVQITAPNAWQSHMLIQCLLCYLFTLYICVVNQNCPHFIIRSNNLMAGRFTQQSKHQLQLNLRWLFDDTLSRGILSLCIDGVADRLMQKLNPDMFGIAGRENDEQCQIICCTLGMYLAEFTQKSVRKMLTKITENRLTEPITLLQQYVQRLEHVYRDGNEIERSACKFLQQYFYTLLGSVLASESLQISGLISPQAFAFFSRGLNSDVSSSRLKLASAFFCAGDIVRAEITLRDLEDRYDESVCSPVCTCIAFQKRVLLTRVEAMSLANDESDIPKLTSACVIFTPAERNCMPQELQYEMYRSTRDDILHRTTDDDWMDLAVVDSLPYLHFLCYKVYARLQRRADQQRALDNLMTAVQRERNFGHTETALNLLGQCMEQENRWDYALQCYSLSLNIRPRNNAAKFHVCRMLYMRYRQFHA